MHVEYRKWYSQRIRRDMELKVYGNWGRPVLVFPTHGGRFYEFEDFGMVHACRDYIEGGRYKFITIDSIDHEAWANFSAHPADRGRRHEDYDGYVIHEVVPFIRDTSGGNLALTMGASIGGYHAANFFFRHPDAFAGCISLSAIFDLRPLVGDYVDDNVYYNSPLFYLPNQNDPWFLERYRQGRIVICAGRGPWEDEMLSDIEQLRGILEAKGIPAWIDIWGHDAAHDWPWWQRQLPYFLGKL